MQGVALALVNQLAAIVLTLTIVKVHHEPVVFRFVDNFIFCVLHQSLGGLLASQEVLSKGLQNTACFVDAYFFGGI